jgi:hypothetical protein
MIVRSTTEMANLKGTEGSLGSGLASYPGIICPVRNAVLP